MRNHTDTKQASLAISQRITVRQMDSEFTTVIPKYWANNNPYLTSLLAAFSVGFPSGERFFIDSVRHYQSQINDPILKDEIKGFIGQEAQHTKEHITFNNFLEKHGYPANKHAESAKRLITRLQKKSSPARNLARTVALEHFTAIICSSILENSELLESTHPLVAKLWAWHAIEEVEHRTVAFDVYKKTVNNEAIRLIEMILVTIGFISNISIRSTRMHIAAGGKLDIKQFANALNTLWGSPGVFRKVIPQYFSYYKKDFHPSQHENSMFLEKAKIYWLFENNSLKC